MLSYSCYGNKRSFPLIFFHGFLGNKADWSYVIKYLCRKFYCISIDLPGHGKSFIDNELNFDSFAKVLLRFLESKNISKLALIGYSMGGRIAHFIHSNYLKNLICICIGSHLGLTNVSEIKIKETWNTKILSYFKDHSIEDFLTIWYSQKLFDQFKKSKIYPEILKERMKNNIELLKKAFCNFSLLTQKILYPDSNIHFIVGQNDHKYLKYYQSLKCTYHIVKNASHVIHLEAPQSLGIKIKEILDGNY
jgi:2-succinyl-6-hydroxy-2,4-cyclohexadiene-1-carboxylate synthase